MQHETQCQNTTDQNSPTKWDPQTPLCSPAINTLNFSCCPIQGVLVCVCVHACEHRWGGGSGDCKLNSPESSGWIPSLTPHLTCIISDTTHSGEPGRRIYPTAWDRDSKLSSQVELCLTNTQERFLSSLNNAGFVRGTSQWLWVTVAESHTDVHTPQGFPQNLPGLAPTRRGQYQIQTVVLCG